MLTSSETDARGGWLCFTCRLAFHSAQLKYRCIATEYVVFYWWEILIQTLSYMYWTSSNRCICLHRCLYEHWEVQTCWSVWSLSICERVSARPSLFYCLSVPIGCRGKTPACQTVHMLGTATPLIFKHFLPLSPPAPCWMSAFELYVKPEPQIRGGGGCDCMSSCAASTFSLPSVASYCAAHAAYRERNTRTAIPLINWLSTAHKFTLCGLIMFF